MVNTSTAIQRLTIRSNGTTGTTTTSGSVSDTSYTITTNSSIFTMGYQTAELAKDQNGIMMANYGNIEDINRATWIESVQNLQIRIFTILWFYSSS